MPVTPLRYPSRPTFHRAPLPGVALLLGVALLVATGGPGMPGAIQPADAAGSLALPASLQSRPSAPSPLSPSLPLHGTSPAAGFTGTQIAASLRSLSGFDARLLAPIGSWDWYVGLRSSNDWGQIGAWVDPARRGVLAPFDPRFGRPFESLENPLIPTELGVHIPVTEVPFLGSLSLHLQDGISHIRTSPFVAADPSTGLALNSVANPSYLAVSHAAAGITLGDRNPSGYRVGLSVEDVLRGYPAGPGFNQDATLLWAALKNLVNLRGQGANASAVGTLPSGLFDLRPDESYYRFSIGRSLGADGNAFARLTFSRIIYNDRSGTPGGPAPGSGSYQGTAGTMQLTWKF